MTLARKISEVRRRTSAAYRNVRLALEEAGGDMEAAVLSLQRAGFAAPEQLLQREARSGRVFAYTSPDGRVGALVELACETDFVANTPDFQAAGRRVAEHVAALDLEDPDVQEVLSSSLCEGCQTVAVRLNQLMGLFGEKVELRKVARVEVGR